MTINTKYSIGDTVYYLEGDIVKKDIVDGIFYSNSIVQNKPEDRFEIIKYELQSFSRTTIMFLTGERDSHRIPEARLFGSKEDLIKSL